FVSLSLTAAAFAVPQPLINTDLSTTLAKGSLEFENRILWSHSGGADELSFSHEIEFGVSENFEVDLYLSEWNWEKVDGEGSKSTWESAGIEGLYSLSNPTSDAIGSAVAVEAQFGDGFWVLEPQLRFQKNFGPLITMLNVVVANEFVRDETDGQEFSQSLGAAYQVTPNFFVGADVSHATTYVDWKHGENEWYAGPAVHFRTNTVWATLGASFRLSADAEDAADVVIGTKFGINW
ncbi:MAG: putative secreted protein, partial [Verrucomicrobiales bacterium]|nr:putative secreted protein [Verrucomicrobiales bacterium]